MYKVFVNDLPIILSTKKNIGKQYTTIPLKEVKFKKLIRKINDGSLLYVNLYHKNEEKLEQFLLKKLPVVFAGGGLVFNAKKEILFIRRNGKWDLPKGKIDAGELPIEAAKREVEEECGVVINKVNELLAETYHLYSLKKKVVFKKTYWYAMAVSGKPDLIPQAEEDITEACWLLKNQLDEVKANSYPLILDLVNEQFK